MQGSLLRENAIFTSFDMDDMERANSNLQKGLTFHQPLKLLFIIDKIKRIGQK